MADMQVDVQDLPDGTTRVRVHEPRGLHSLGRAADSGLSYEAAQRQGERFRTRGVAPLTRFEPRATGEPYRASERGDPVESDRRNALEYTGSSDIWRLRTERRGGNDYPEPCASELVERSAPEHPGSNPPGPLSAEEVFARAAEYWRQRGLAPAELETLRRKILPTGFERTGTPGDRVSDRYQRALDRHWRRMRDQERLETQGETLRRLLREHLNVSPDDSSLAEIMRLTRLLEPAEDARRSRAADSWPKPHDGSRTLSWGAQTRDLKRLQQMLDEHNTAVRL
jgi:hypothetical protein